MYVYNYIHVYQQHGCIYRVIHVHVYENYVISVCFQVVIHSQWLEFVYCYITYASIN